MTASLPSLRGLLTGSHATRVKGDAALSSVIRTVEGGHGRSPRGTDSDGELRFVRLASIEMAVRSHRGHARVAIQQRSPTSGYIVQFNLAGKAIAVIDGRRTPIPVGRAILIPPGCRFERETEDNFGIAVIFNGAAVRARLAERISRTLDAPIVFQTRVDSAHDALLAMVVAIDRALETRLVRPGDAALDALQQAFVDLLLDLQPHSYSSRLADGSRARKSMRIEIVRELVDRDPSAPLTLEDLAAAADCGIRSLQTTFAEYVATSPIDFVRRRRLELARHRLLDPSVKATISEIASRHGFQSHSRFAAEYRRIYGETPSETRGAERRRPGSADR